MTNDNNANFVGAVNELKELVGQLDNDKFQRTTTQKRVKWTVNPPGAPHFSGVHEVIVKAAKKAIAKDLITVVTGAESLLNSRPLTYQSTNLEDDVPLTPNNCTRERQHHEVQPAGEVAQGPRIDLPIAVQVVEGVLTYAEYSSKVD